MFAMFVYLGELYLGIMIGLILLTHLVTILQRSL